MKAVLFWLAICGLAVWGSVAGFEYISDFQSKELFEQGCKKTGATRKEWSVVHITTTNVITFVPVQLEEEEYYCAVTDVKIWRVK